MEKPKPGIRAQMLSDRQVDKLADYQAKIRALRDNYASFEVALAEAQLQLKATNELVASKKKELANIESVESAKLTALRESITKEVAQLKSEKSDLSASVTQMHTELHQGVENLAKKQKVVDDLDRDLRCGFGDLKVSIADLAKKAQGVTDREAELDRVEDHNNEIKAHTLQIEERIAQKQAQLDKTLDEIKNNRLAETEAKKEAEAAKQTAEVARKELVVAQNERNDLRARIAQVEEKYKHSCDLYDGAKDLERKNKVKELALRNVEIKLNEGRGQLKQAQTQLVREIETFRREKENGGV